MQSCASAAKLQGGGPILNRGSKAMSNSGVPPPRIFICSYPCTVASCRNSAATPGHHHAAARSARLSGISPAVASRQSVISSLRASAIIMVLRGYRGEHPRCAHETTRQVGYPSDARENPRRVGSCHDVPGCCRFWRDRVRVAFYHSRRGRL